MDYKIISIDLDGTLLTDNKNITNKNIQILKSLHEKGVEVVIATGRKYSSAKQLVNKLEIEDLTIIANNGSVVRNTHNDNILSYNYIANNDYVELVRLGKEYDFDAIVHIDDSKKTYDIIGEKERGYKRYYNYLGSIKDRYKKVNNILDYRDENILAVVYPSELKLLQEFKKKIVNKIDGNDKFNIYLMESLVKISPILEMINKKASKWRALEKYSQSKNIKAEEIISIGDDYNDFEMLSKSGLGIAMKNSNKDMKAVADIVTDSDNNNSGLGKTLEKIFKI